MINLKNVTLVGIDCLNLNRLFKAIEISTEKINFAEIKILSSIKNDKVIKIPKISSIEEYSKFMIKELNNYVDTDYVLIIQYDGFVLNEKAWSDAFLNYDYIGACWWYSDKMNVGNGGFSLRSKKLLTILQKDENILLYHPEDHQICREYGIYLKNEYGIKFAPNEIANIFSIEGVDINTKNKYMPKTTFNETNKWNGQFGFHGLQKTDISNWIKNNKKFKIKNELTDKHIW